jgi:hypothetical protein
MGGSIASRIERSLKCLGSVKLRPIIPYPTGRFFRGRFPRHFVQAAIGVAYGTGLQTVRNGI